MAMPSPVNSSETGGRLTGDDMRRYMQAFADRFLPGVICYETEVLQIKRSEDGTSWDVLVQTTDSTQTVLTFSRIVLCSGVSLSLLQDSTQRSYSSQGCDKPQRPIYLSADAAMVAGFAGPVIHSKHFGQALDDLLAKIQPASPDSKCLQRVVIIGGGKSAQEYVGTP